MSRPQLQIAIGERSLTVSTGWSGALPTLSAGAIDWTEIAATFEAMKQALSVAAARVTLVLLPPLVQVRRIELPRIPDADLERVLSRDIARYLPVVGTQVVGFQRIGKGTRARDPLLVACASTELVERLAEEIERLGWTLERVTAAHWSWVDAVQQGLTSASANRATAGRYLVSLDGALAEVLRIEDGRLTEVRRTPRSLPRLLAALREHPGSEVTLIGGSDEVNQALCQAGFQVQLLAGSAASLAAGGSSTNSPPELAPARVKQLRVIWSARWQRRLWMGTAAALLLSVGLTRWGLARELAAIRHQRLEYRDAVMKAMVVRDSSEGVRQQLVLLTKAEETAPRWTAILGSVTKQLPDDAFLTSFRGRADSLQLEGVAEQAAGVFEALARADGLVGVQANAPIRQTMAGGVTTNERFTLTAKVAISPGRSGVRP